MRAQISRSWEETRSSYWFVPSLLLLGSVLLSAVTTLLDYAFGMPSGAETWLAFNTAGGARELLSTIAGSMITVAGVTFSITIAAVAYASAQLGPRLLGNFMRDSANQVTLGTFVATFLYCLLILRTVHGGEGGEEVFVPHYGVLTALILALASLAVLVHFIHHIPMSIQASHVVAQIGRELHDKLDVVFPSQVGEDAEEGGPAPDFPPGGREMRARQSGYLTHVDGKGLIKLAQKHDLRLHIACRPGDFVTAGLVLAHVQGQADERIWGHIEKAFALSQQRTQAQDIMFLVQQLAEIAVRALSPGVNDPFTAINCLDWLTSGLIAAGQRRFPSGLRCGDDGEIRISASAVTFAQFCSAIFDQIRPYAAKDRNVALHMMEVLDRAMSAIPHRPYQVVLHSHAAILKDAALRELEGKRDREQLLGIYERISRREPGRPTPVD